MKIERGLNAHAFLQEIPVRDILAIVSFSIFSSSLELLVSTKYKSSTVKLVVEYIEHRNS